MKYIDFFGDLIETTIDERHVLKFINKEIYIGGHQITTSLHMETADHYYLISVLTDFFGSNANTILLEAFQISIFSTLYLFLLLSIVH